MGYQKKCLLLILLSILFFPIKEAIGQRGRGNSLSNELSLIGQVGGPTTCLALSGSHAYLGVGLKIIVLDISNPAAPKEVGATEALPDFVTEVKTDGNKAFVTAGGAGLYLFDISNPASPQKLSSYDSIGFSENVLISGNRAYLSDGWAGIQILNISDKSKPAEISSIQTLGYAFDVTLIGQYLYVASGGAGLRVVDVSNPLTPVEISSFDTPGYSYGIASEGEKVYIADGWEGIRIVDVSDPEIPVEVGFYKTPGWAFDVEVSGNFAYVADSFGGLRILDVSNSSQPKEIGAYEVGGWKNVKKLAVRSDLAFITDRYSGLRVVNISNRREPKTLSSFGLMGEARDVAIMGNFAYVAAGYNGLQIIDISDPYHPKLIGSYITQSFSLSAAASGNYAYLATGPDSDDRGLHIVNISDPAKPKMEGFYPISPGGEHGGAVRDMTIKGGIAYIADEAGLLMIDVNNPSAPAFSGFIRLVDDFGHAASSVAVNKKMAYVGRADSLKIVDVSNPQAPILVGSFNITGQTEGIDSFEDKVYIAGGWSGLRIIDVSTANQPKEIGFYDTRGWAFHVTVYGALCYIADGSGGIEIVDVSNPANPILVGFYNTPGFAYSVIEANQVIFVADGEDGLVLLKKNSTSGIAKVGQSIQQKFNRQSDYPSGLNDFSKSDLVRARQSSFTAIDRIPSQEPLNRRSDLSAPPSTPGIKSGFISSTAAFSSQSASSLVVTNNQDSGSGTLRRCLEEAVSGSTITFDSSFFSPDHPITIQPLSPLPTLTQGKVTIDASNAGVILEGSRLRGEASGLVVASDENRIKGLQIFHFPKYGLLISNGAMNNQIGGNPMSGHGPSGEGNVISCNGRENISIEGTGTSNNRILGNKIGTDPSGSIGLINGGAGIRLASGTQHNMIGGNSPEERNIISGDGCTGIHMIGAGTMHNIVTGNYIGTDKSGTVLGGRKGTAINITDGASYNQIGGLTAAERNIISGGENSRFRFLGRKVRGIELLIIISGRT